MYNISIVIPVVIIIVCILNIQVSCGAYPLFIIPDQISLPKLQSSTITQTTYANELLAKFTISAYDLNYIGHQSFATVRKSTDGQVIPIAVDQTTNNPNSSSLTPGQSLNLSQTISPTSATIGQSATLGL